MRRRRTRLALACLLGLALVGPAGRGTAAAGWQFVRPHGKTGCAHGGLFGFWARLADPAKLLLFLRRRRRLLLVRHLRTGQATASLLEDESLGEFIGGPGGATKSRRRTSQSLLWSVPTSAK